MKRIASIAAIIGMMSFGGMAFAKGKKNAVSGKKHPNLAAAQKLIEQAEKKIEAAQKANEFDLDGHAQKAKDALDTSYTEIKAAAEVSNANATGAAAEGGNATPADGGK